MPKNTLTQAEFAQLCFKLKEQAEGIEKSLANGLTVSALARQHSVADTTMTSVLQTIGVKFGRGPRETPIANDIIIVLARLCKECGVDYSEIKKYITE